MTYTRRFLILCIQGRGNTTTTVLVRIVRMHREEHTTVLVLVKILYGTVLFAEQHEGSHSQSHHTAHRQISLSLHMHVEFSSQRSGAGGPFH